MFRKQNRKKVDDMCNIGFLAKIKVIEKPKIGWRWLEIKNQELVSVLYAGSDTWVNTKIHKASSPPRLSNNTGLYFFFSKEEAKRQSIGYNFLLAKCEYWGKCCIHEKGVRAEYAKILFLYPSKKQEQRRYLYGWRKKNPMMRHVKIVRPIKEKDDES